VEATTELVDRFVLVFQAVDGVDATRFHQLLELLGRAAEPHVRRRRRQRHLLAVLGVVRRRRHLVLRAQISMTTTTHPFTSRDRNVGAKRIRLG